MVHDHPITDDSAVDELWRVSMRVSTNSGFDHNAGYRCFAEQMPRSSEASAEGLGKE